MGNTKSSTKVGRVISDEYIVKKWHSELLTCLDSNAGRDALLQHAFSLNRHKLLLHLLDTVGVNSETEEIPNQVLFDLCHDCVSERGSLSRSSVLMFATRMDTIRRSIGAGNVIGDKSHVDDIRQCCIDATYRDIYVPFSSSRGPGVSSDSYSCTAIKCDSFDYFTRLDMGTSGISFLCRRRSTRLNYCMKVVLKGTRAKGCDFQYSDVMLENRVLRMTNHPFIASAHYCFQTPLMTMIVTPAAECGTLAHILDRARGGRLPLPRIKFYVAEICSALIYLHSHNILYGNVAPEGVSLRMNGHIVLSNFGYVSELKLLDDFDPPNPVDKATGKSYVQGEKTLLPSVDSFVSAARFDMGLRGQQENATKVDESIDLSYAGSNLVASDEIPSRKILVPSQSQPEQWKRGSPGYMAPECYASCIPSDVRKDHVVCNDGSDWFSLGALLSRMLHGPSLNSNGKIGASHTEIRRKFIQSYMNNDCDFNEAYRNLFGNLAHDPSQTFRSMKCESASTVDLLQGLLHIDVHARYGRDLKPLPVAEFVGSRSNSYQNLKNHSFFSGIDWVELMNGTADPPTCSEVLGPLSGSELRALPEMASFGSIMSCPWRRDKKHLKPLSFAEIMTVCGREIWLNADEELRNRDMEESAFCCSHSSAVKPDEIAPKGVLTPSCSPVDAGRFHTLEDAAYDLSNSHSLLDATWSSSLFSSWDYISPAAHKLESTW